MSKVKIPHEFDTAICCYGCGVLLEEAGNGIHLAPDEAMYCNSCQELHNGTIDEVLALVKEQTFTNFSVHQIAATGQVLYKAIEKLKFPEEKDDDPICDINSKNPTL